MAEQYDETRPDTTSDQPVVSSERYQILLTEEDKTGTDILAMSDFLDGCMEEMTRYIRSGPVGEVVADIPVSDMMIISEAVNQAKVVTKGMVQYVPDFEHLPKEIKDKIKQGIYKLGQSRQVEGNVRAVLIDQDGVRVKDVTLKKIQPNPGMMETSRSVANQIQMKQISSKLDSIEAMQSYQIARDRDRDIYRPFLDARAFILRAQMEEQSEEVRRYNLKRASEELLSSLTSVYLDIETSRNHLLKHTRRKILLRKKAVNEFIGFLSTDIQVLSKMTGLRIRVLSCLEDKKSIQIEIDRYKNKMTEFFTRELPDCRCSTAELIHQYYPYTKDNMNCWYDLAADVKNPLEELEKKGMDQVFLVSMEDVTDGRE